MNEKINRLSNQFKSKERYHSGQELMMLIKKSRELSFLGLYEESISSYIESLAAISIQIVNAYDIKVSDRLKKLEHLLKIELEENSSLHKMITSQKLSQKKGSPPKRSGLMAQPPFSFHDQMRHPPTNGQDHEQRRASCQATTDHNNYYSQRENYKGSPDKLIGNYDNYNSHDHRHQDRVPPRYNEQRKNIRHSNSRERQIVKDPQVWDPPSPTKNRQKPKSFNPNYKNATQPGNYIDRSKRNYPKPWLKPESQPQVKSNQPSEEPSQTIEINGVEKKRYLYNHYPDGNGPDTDLINMIENNLILTNPGISFDDIAGLNEAKEVLTMYVVCALNMKNFFKGIRSPPKGILLYGPPGTGKTMLAKAIATTGKTTFININPAAIASKWRGDSEKLVRLLFDMARYYAPSTIFIDEIDSLLSDRSSNEHESSRKVKTQFFTEIDGINGSTGEESMPNVFVLAATNRPWDLDDAILRRLTKRIYIPLPNFEARKKLFNLKLKNIKMAEGVQFDFLAEKTDRYNSDDIESVCREAANAPFKRVMSQIADKNSTQFLQDLEQQILDEPINNDDFLQALSQVKSSATDKFTQQYTDWSKNYGST